MYCYQCEQTANGTGCTSYRRLRQGARHGRPARPAGPRDQGHFDVSPIGRPNWGPRDREVDRAILDFLFATVTNVDFDPARLQGHCSTPPRSATGPRRSTKRPAPRPARRRRRSTAPPPGSRPPISTDWSGRAKKVSLTKRQARLGNDVTGLQELILYGLKGAAAYADHARILGYEDPDVYATFHAALDFLTRENPTTDAIAGLGDEGRRVEPHGDGPAGRRQHEHLRPSRAHAESASRRSAASASASPATT